MDAAPTYHRLTFRQRGHFTNYPTFRSVQALRFQPTELLITQAGKEIAVPYINSFAPIKKSYVAKPYGGTAHAWVRQTLVSVVAINRKRYTFDLSGQFPDFKETAAILESIEKKFKVETTSETLAQVKRRNLMSALPLLAALIVLFLLVKHYGI